MDCIRVGKLIFALRKEKGMTQKQLAEAMNISDKAISKWERGLGCPDVSLLGELSEILSVDIGKILLGDLELNDADGGNMNRVKFFVCPIVGEPDMNRNPNFHPIDLQTWPMAQSFHYYTQMAPTTYTVNVSMDVTILRKALKDRGYKFFPAYLYLITKAICDRQELRIAVQDSVAGYWGACVKTQA